jgi:hypothetical protein
MWTRQDQQAADDQAAERDGCLRDTGRTPCSGPVRYRYSELGTAIPECVEHMRESEAINAAARARYPAPGARGVYPRTSTAIAQGDCT